MPVPAYTPYNPAGTGRPRIDWRIVLGLVITRCTEIAAEGLDLRMNDEPSVIDDAGTPTVFEPERPTLVIHAPSIELPPKVRSPIEPDRALASLMLELVIPFTPDNPSSTPMRLMAWCSRLIDAFHQMRLTDQPTDHDVHAAVDPMPSAVIGEGRRTHTQLVPLRLDVTRVSGDALLPVLN